MSNISFTRLPFDVHKRHGCMGHIRVPKGMRCALYVHGRECGSVVFNHPVRCLEWDFEETFERYGLNPIRCPETNDLVQYEYMPAGAKLVETNDDGHIKVLSGTTLWEAEPFSSYCPLYEEERPLDTPCAGFAGVVHYYLANPA